MKREEVVAMVHNLKAIKAHLVMAEIYTPQLVKAVEFLEGVAPILNQMCDSISESSNAMPRAAEQLDKVTDATEMAATEVMDVVDQSMARVERITDHIARLKEVVEDEDRFVSHLSSNIEAIGAMNGNVKAIKAAVRNLEKIVEERMKAKTLKETFGGITEDLTALQDDLFTILNALQFQDITSQQIRSTNRMLADVNVRLRDLLGNFSDVRMDAMDPSRYQAFDSKAAFDFEWSGETQDLVDHLLSENTNAFSEAQGEGDPDENMEEQIDQDAIDALFK